MTVPDGLRIVICLEAILVGALYLSSLVRTLCVYRDSNTPMSKRVFWGRAARFAAISCMVVAVVIDHVSYIGDPLHASTAVLQAAVILFAASWHLIDRAIYVK